MPLLHWILFSVFILILLFIDLKVVMNHPEKITIKKAAIYSTVWISLGLAFTGVVGWLYGSHQASEYITAFLIEKSLSIDNVFLWAVIFTTFGVDKKYQHEVLFWGVFGALVLRAIFIVGGVALLSKFEWIVYVFGALLLITAFRLFFSRKEKGHASEKMFQWISKVIPHTETFHGDKFFVKENGKRLATPLFTVLVMVELADLLFAVDSIPAILAVTRSQFIVFSSNAFAILGLRALYFLLADMKDRFVYLDKGLAIILAFVGIKFIISHFIEIPIWLSLAFIAVVMTITILLSLRKSRKLPTR